MALPNSCLLCRGAIVPAESFICSPCLYALPNPSQRGAHSLGIDIKLKGLLPHNYSFALFGFNRGSKVRHLIHNMKYGGDGRLAYQVGIWMGAAIRQNGPYPAWDYIVPVPLHPGKLKERGFNQANKIAKGLSRVLGTVVLDALAKTSEQVTQTNLDRWHRFQNVSNQFKLTDPLPDGSKVLLVDDVMTTGATLVACSQTLLQNPLQISLAVAALTSSH